MLSLVLLLSVSAQADADLWATRASAFARIWGPSAYENVRGPVATGDLDGDGTIELLVANPLGFTLEYSVGTVHLLDLDQLSGDVSLHDYVQRLQGDDEHDYFGVSMAVIPGVSGGPDMVAVGADHSGLTETDPGEISLFRGPLPAADNLRSNEANTRWTGDIAADRLGSSVCNPGDLDGDGISDIAMAAPFRKMGTGEGTTISRIWIIHGPLAGLIGDFAIADLASAWIEQDGTDGAMGWRMAAPGDQNGDGLPDLLASAFDPDHPFAGEIGLYAGLWSGDGGAVLQRRQSDAVTTWTHDELHAYAGMGLAARDLDGDQQAEILVGAPYGANQSGKVWLITDPEAGTQSLDDAASAIFEGESGSASGISIDATENRVLVGAPGTDRVHVLDTDLLLLGSLMGSGDLGSRVQRTEDLDGDGQEDVALVAPRASGTLTEQGLVALISGHDLESGNLPDWSDAETGAPDADEDGSPEGEDCDDQDPDRSPDHLETCSNQVDDDCDGEVDESECTLPSTPCGCTQASAPPFSLLAGLLLIAGIRRNPGAADVGNG